MTLGDLVLAGRERNLILRIAIGSFTGYATAHPTQSLLRVFAKPTPYSRTHILRRKPVGEHHVTTQACAPPSFSGQF